MRPDLPQVEPGPATEIFIARELGGGRYAQFLTGLAVLLAPGVLATDSLMTMNAFEPVFWMSCILVLARILRTGNSRLWPRFGVFAGLGLETKHSTLFFGAPGSPKLVEAHDVSTPDRARACRHRSWSTHEGLQPVEAMTRGMLLEDAVEGMDAFLQKRPAAWRGR